MRSLLVLLAAAACATPRQAAPGTNTAFGNDDDLICHEVANTGSLFTHTECQTRAQADAEREDARRFITRPLAPPPAPVPPSAGPIHR
jgi:hypothetical protein